MDTKPPVPVVTKQPAIATRTVSQTVSDPFFAIDRIHTVRITLTKEDWDALQPKAMAGFLQMDFEQRPATVEIDGKPVDVRLRFKGNGTYMLSGGFLKRPFKLEPATGKAFDLPGKPTKVNLNNNIMDSSGLREAVAYDVFRRLGVPAPRTAFAKVVLNVPGVADKKTLGLYTVAEQVDDRFLAKHFGKAPTLVLKPEGAVGMPKRNSWKDIEKMYDPKGKPTAADKRRFQGFLEFVHDASDAEFAANVGDWLDIDAFAKFLAGTVVTSSMDSILVGGHNYYVVLHPTTGKFYFLPWDLDLAFGGFPLAGADGVKLSVDQPAIAQEVLIKRFLAVPRCKDRYRAACRQVADLMRSSEPLRKRLETVVAPVVKQEDRTAVAGGIPGMGGFPGFGGPARGGAPGAGGPPPGGGFGGFGGFGGPGRPGGGPGSPNPGAGGPPPGGGFGGGGFFAVPVPRQGGRPGGPGGPFGFGGPNPFETVALKQFLQERPKQVMLQLAGKAVGETPRGMMMPGMGGPGRPGAGGGRPGAGGPPGGFGGFDLGAMVAGAVGTFLGDNAAEFDRAAWENVWKTRLESADSNRDGTVDQKEWDALVDRIYADQPGFARIFPGQVRNAFSGTPFELSKALSTVAGWFGRFDSDKNGKLVRKEFGEGMLGALPPPDFSQIPNPFGGAGFLGGGAPPPGGPGR